MATRTITVSEEALNQFIEVWHCMDDAMGPGGGDMWDTFEERYPRWSEVLGALQDARDDTGLDL